LNAERGVKDINGDIMDLNKPVVRGLATGLEDVVASGVEFTDPEGKISKGAEPQ
jgi:hypothetical protein